MAYAWLAAIALAALGAFFGGTQLKQGEWDAAELNRSRLEREALDRLAGQARASSSAHERTRAALEAQLRSSRDALSIALRTPISCPAPGDKPLELGDIVLPAGTLDGVRDAGRAAAGPGAAAGESGSTL